MLTLLKRQPWLSGLVALGLASVVWAWLTPTPAAGSRDAVGPKDTGKSTGVRAVRPTPRSLSGLNLETQKDVPADARPPAEAKAALVRTGLDEIQELKQLNTAKFDEAAKRWGQTPRVKELIERWKGLEESWKTQDETTQASVVPEMRAMWREALDLLRAEVEK